MGDEDFEGDEQLAGPTKQTAQKRGRNAEMQPSEDETDEGFEGEEDADDESAGVPSHLNIIVEKPGKGAMQISASIMQGSIVVENVHYYENAELAHSKSAELQGQAQERYGGPSFGTLDEDLQILMERYLEDRGITQNLAYFVPQYMELKEQKEYLKWLNNVKSFIRA